jgi:hypothetical protein
LKLSGKELRKMSLRYFDKFVCFKNDFTGYPVKDTNLSYKEKLIEASKKRKQERLKIHKKKPRHLHKFSDWK